MKKLVTIAIAALAGQLLAATITWTGGGDGYTWSDGGNWSSGSNPGAAFTDDLVIDGDSGTFSHGDGKKVIYTSGDMAFTGTLTIQGGATLYQDADSWPNFSGSVIVENGTFDMSHATGANNYGNVTIHEGGLVVVSSSFTRPDTSVLSMDGGELRIGGSFSFKPDDSVSGGSIVCYGTSDFNLSQDLTLSGVSLTVYIVVPSNEAKISLDGASLVATCSEKGQFGFYGRYAGVLNFVSGSPSSYTFPSSYAGTAAALYNAMVSPGYITLDGSAISESDFYSKFDVSFDTDAGTCTMSLKTLEGWSVGTPSAGEVDAQNNVTVTFTATKHSGSDTANVYVGCASSDLGDDIANWVGSLVTVAEGVSETTTYTPQLTLADGLNYIRTFVTYGGDTVASSAISVRVLAYGDYGDLTDVYEYIGSDNNLSTAANWAKDKSAPASEAPVAGTNIRWFGRNDVLTVSSFDLYSTDHFVGATINTTSGNHDCHLNGDILLVDSSVTLSTIIIGETPYTITLTNSHFTTTRCPDGVAGFYENIPDRAVNFLSGAPSFFSFGKDNTEAHDSESTKTQLVDGGKLLLDGAAITDEAWNQYFTVDVEGDVVTVAYNPVVAAYRIESVDAVATASSATISATIGETRADASVYVAYVEGNAAPSDQALLAGTNLGTTFKGAVVSTNLAGLSEFVSYSYTFGLVVGGNVVAKKRGSFTASDYKYAYINGAWINGTAPKNLAVLDSVLITGTYTTGSETNPKNKTLRDAVVMASTILYGDGASMTLCNATYTNMRDNSALASNVQYGIYESTHPLNFTSASGNGVVKRGDAYACYATEEQCAAVYANLFASEKIRLDGSAVDEDAFRASFTTNVVDTDKAITINEETVPLKQLTVTYWESVWTGVPKADWTIQTGARVKLTKNTRIGALDIPDASDVKIDLNGYELKVSSLTIAGEKKKGEFTAETLPAILIGEGKLVVGGRGLAVFVR